MLAQRPAHVGQVHVQLRIYPGRSSRSCRGVRRHNNQPYHEHGDEDAGADPPPALAGGFEPWRTARAGTLLQLLHPSGNQPIIGVAGAELIERIVVLGHAASPPRGESTPVIMADIAPGDKMVDEPATVAYRV